MLIESAQAKINKALEYAKLGYWPTRLHGVVNGVCTCGKLDCGSKGKHPNTKNGYKDATQDPDIIRRWWAEAPLSNLGLCPREGQVAIDVDPKNDGDKTWAEWQEEYGAIGRTPTSRTGSGGFHYLLSLPAGVVVKNTANKVGPGVDLRSHGGLIVVEPSVTDKGGYEWIIPLSEPIAPCPDWLVEKIRESKGFKDHPAAKPQAPRTGGSTSWTWEDRADDFPSHPGTPSGVKPDRHSELCRLIGVHINRGDSLRTIEAMAIEWACRCTPPVPEKDVVKAVKGLASKEAAKAPSDGEEPQAPRSGAMGSEPETGDLGSDPKPEPEGESPAPAPLGVSSPEAESTESEETDDWPILGDDALIGLAGDIIRAIEPETEADPAGILITLLTAFGNAVEHGPFARVGPVKHHANIFPVIVGATASRKGQGLSVVKWAMAEADPDWYANAIGYGLSSGEGLIDRVRDEEDFEGVKRLFAIEEEFYNLMQVKGREGNTLSNRIRNAWDGVPMEAMTRGRKGVPPIKASRHHISILGHITPKELAKAMGGSVDIANGFANRFLWTAVRRAGYLPEGGDIEVIRPYIEPLSRAIAKAKEIRFCWRDDEAKALWAEVYRELSDADDEAIGRAEGQTLRLSLIYALLDGSQIIGERHLRAALAVWRYCEASARILFGGSDTPQGRGDQPLHIRLLDAIAKEPGIGRDRLRQILPSRMRGEVGEALAKLRSQRLAHPRTIATNGRPAEGWHPGPGDDPDPKPTSSPFTFTWGDDAAGTGWEGKGEETPPARSQDLPSLPVLDQTQDGKPEPGDLPSLPVLDQTHEPGDLPSLPVLDQTQDGSRGAESPAPASLGVSSPEPYLTEDEAMPNDEGHIEAMRAWADALAEKVKAVAHRLEPEALARLGDQTHIEALAKRLYVQTWRCRPDKRKSDPLPPEIEGDILWLERVAERLAKDDARIKALRSREMPPEEWEEALTQAFDAIDGEEKL